MTLGLEGTPAVTEAIHNTINTEKHKQTYWEITVIAIQCSSPQPFFFFFLLAETVVNTVMIYFIIHCIVLSSNIFPN